MDINSVRIRTGKSIDLDRVSELWQALVDYHVQLDTRMAPASPGGEVKWRNRLAKLLEDPTFRLLVAEAPHGELVGFATGFLHYAPEVFESQKLGKVADIFVIEPWRHQGIGRRLLAVMTEWFQQEQVEAIVMNLVNRNPAAVQFWRSVGSQEYTQQMWLPVDWVTKGQDEP